MADVNENGALDTQDAAAVVNHILDLDQNNDNTENGDSNDEPSEPGTNPDNSGS